MNIIKSKIDFIYFFRSALIAVILFVAIFGGSFIYIKEVISAVTKTSNVNSTYNLPQAASTFYDGNRWWNFYVADSTLDMTYKYSADGITWSAESVAVTDNNDEQYYHDLFLTE